MKNKFSQKFIITIILSLMLTLIPGLTVAQATSNLNITNQSGDIFYFTYEQLFAMPKITVYADLYCDGSLATSGNWSGVLLSYLLTQTQITPQVASVQFEASDGYKVAIPIDLAMNQQTIIAYEKDHQTLPEKLRLILPEANGAAWIALITSITMSTSGTSYPQAASAGGGKISDITSFSESNTATATLPPQIDQPKQHPTKPESTPSTINATSEKVTGSNQPTPKPESTITGRTDWEVGGLIATSAAAVMGLIAVGYILYKHKQTPNASIEDLHLNNQ